MKPKLGRPAKNYIGVTCGDFVIIKRIDKDHFKVKCTKCQKTKSISMGSLYNPKYRGNCMECNGYITPNLRIIKMIQRHPGLTQTEMAKLLTDVKGKGVRRQRIEQLTSKAIEHHYIKSKIIYEIKDKGWDLLARHEGDGKEGEEKEKVT